MSNFVDTNNSNRGENESYRDVIGQIKKDEICPFCPENLSKYHKKPILEENDYWLLTENMYPYSGAKCHLLAIHKVHIEDVSQVSKEAWGGLLEIIQRETEKINIKGGTFYMRFGNTAHTGASVVHLHANLVSPDTEDKNRKPIMFRIG
ncbi:MAG: HIT domain-containing protein [Patescibacteria group bacterium]